MKTARYGELTFRRVRLEGRIPWDLIKGVRERDPASISEAREWARKYTILVLFTQGLVVGDEEVILTDEGELFVEVTDIRRRTLKKRVRALSAELQAVVATFPLDDVWAKRVLGFLKIHESPI